jgi:hypothetical protein
MLDSAERCWITNGSAYLRATIHNGDFLKKKKKTKVRMETSKSTRFESVQAPSADKTLVEQWKNQGH